MIKGKALVVITRLADQHNGGFHFDVYPFIQSCSGEHDQVYEEFSFMEYDVVPLPNQAYKLNVGDTLRVSVVYEIHFPSYENRGDGCEMYLDKVRVRRVQRAKELKRDRHSKV